MTNKCIVICGQTGTGKSDLAVFVALKLKKLGIKSEIISADSRQVYIGFDKTSAKITKKEMHGIPHHMLSIVSPKKNYSVAAYKKEATKIIKDLQKKNIVPIICGGTGLYIDNLVFKKTIPEVAPNKELRKKLEKLSLEELQNLLIKKDKERAQNIDLKNRVRIIRALEIIEKLGYVPKEEKPVDLYETLFIGLYLDKEILEERIKIRTEKRIKSGMIKELENLRDKEKISYKKLESFGMEYYWISKLLLGEINKEICIEGINKDTLSYSKRQMTWFKKNKKTKWLNTKDKNESFNEAFNIVKNFIN